MSVEEVAMGFVRGANEAMSSNQSIDTGIEGRDYYHDPRRDPGGRWLEFKMFNNPKRVGKRMVVDRKRVGKRMVVDS